jgi:hypothetical protein
MSSDHLSALFDAVSDNASSKNWSALASSVIVLFVAAKFVSSTAGSVPFVGPMLQLFGFIVVVVWLLNRWNSKSGDENET